ncbi:MAG: 50S ribosomal protein L11 [Candidatus Kerfeldbacteria bacterium RIFCSPHIGHO2_02_FULL_42_14]|uniref:Large ribosomal subunit protein uL11 n=1 Tax=Candidatus Kerfeldbacteria bacterium RIFCSPHIGHO2_02_FULL_42_14 TaxID=1798540 RepID=A0A1G2ASS3_9BACT|nr:MAG: 50S ribosomal protein L11 [Candidatus Kerfeldbacteria bacterium RIFCSPHIGHO2_02_FULL_42_14]OGY80690.1 MAG: 50S ribosomal protein L11 [Candidatus Kerfeldbacteria bacterium RIFCSPHIGHO2_12_FULL_42_13]OGY82617.1 MAG: 50S ribosomal protein L11 [Candidatus Kerfeldbacteria bacterium RIFCSPLOWO2_02_FULL_42_19]OGY85220.1 MAG: 50S ribosomal protein L11 [Candidatus Kerfeldbacteria bacterium RIFCSPLOWO2_12_FULL_43_9]
MAKKTKKIKTVVKLQIPAGKATPAPPIGPAIGQHGLNIQEFCQKFNEKTRDKQGNIIPVEMTVYEDRTYDFILKTPPASDLLKKAAGIEKGAGNPLTQKVGTITKTQLREIAAIKLPDLNTNDINAAARMIEGTARQMGLTVVEK